MKKRLIVHVGAGKTGSSAIQEFLALNRDALRSAGIVVPGVDMSLDSDCEGHQVWYFDRLLRLPDAPIQFMQQLQQITESASGANAILISSENLSDNVIAPQIISSAKEAFDISVILYIRRQDELILSAWQQWYCKIYADFTSWIPQALKDLGHWRPIVERWYEVCDVSAFKLRRFQSDSFTNGNLIDDFLEAAALPIEASCLKRVATVNPSLSDSVTSIMEGKHKLFKSAHDTDFFDMIIELTGDDYKRKKGQSRLSVEGRYNIVAHYRTENDWIRERFFPSIIGDLFLDVWHDKSLSQLSEDQVRKEGDELLWLLVLALHKEVVALRKRINRLSTGSAEDPGQLGKV